jgi:hypothetical protein
MKESALLAKIASNPDANHFNNFHGFFPGGHYRALCADEIKDYLYPDTRFRDKESVRIHRLLRLFVIIDAKILELGYRLSDVRIWVQYGELRTEHQDLMVKMFVYLVNQGYTKTYLQR